MENEKTHIIDKISIAAIVLGFLYFGGRILIHFLFNL